MRSLFFPRRATESIERTPESLADNIVTAGGFGGFGIDPIDGDSGFVRAGSTGRQVPIWTLEKSRAYSVVAYRVNPMARAIIDTYTSFCIGDSGVTLQCAVPEVRAVAAEFWNDPKVRLGDRQPDMFRDHLLVGETCLELMVGSLSGATRFSVIDTMRIDDILIEAGNPLWPAQVVIRNPDSSTIIKQIANVDDLTGLRAGECAFFASWKALLTDRRGTPFLSPILDQLDDYDTVLSNLVDRTALMRYIGIDVTLKGQNVDDKAIEDYIRKRGGTHIPRSGTVEVHNDSVEMKPFQGMTGAMEDVEVDKAILTNVAGGAGLAKTWLADPQDSNRATSLTMAEPVRRRVGGVQNIWIGYMTELVRFAVDQAVAAGRLAPTVTITREGGSTDEVPTSQTVSVYGPEIAAQNAEVNAMVIFNLGQGIEKLVAAKAMSPAAAQLAVKKAWESFVGLPYPPELDAPNVPTTADDIAQEIESLTLAG